MSCLTLSFRAKRNSGFTLVELFVVLVIISILFGLGYANFRNYSRRQAVMGVARQMEGDVRLAQELALMGKKPTGCIILNGYRFKVENSTFYTIYANCTNSLYEHKSVTIPAESKISLSTTPTSEVLFKSLAQGVCIKADCSGSSMTITLIQDKTNIRVSVAITSGGSTSVQFVE